MSRRFKVSDAFVGLLIDIGYGETVTFYSDSGSEVKVKIGSGNR